MADTAREGWRFWIDRGGTFTDLVARAPDGTLTVRKVLSEQPHHPGDPAIRALRQCLGLAAADSLPPGLVEEVRLGTTVATNALLERQVEPVLLLVNRGFADLHRIGDQHRPDIFALRIRRPEPLPMRVLEVPGRLAADGRELEPFQPDRELEEQLRAALADGYRSCAVALLHAYRQPAHELVLGALLEELGFAPVVLSHRVSGQPRLVPRLHTTVVEAALRPVLDRYLRQVRLALGGDVRLRVMTSAGVLQAPAVLQAKDTILSGPAGGMVGAVAAARAAGLVSAPILGFDMGGTSTDVFHWQGSDGGGEGWERSRETEIAGLRLQASMLPIHTVAAGGGSVLHVDGGRLQVGPRSAGADPGPACYRRGGPLTITDANLLLGRLPLDALPPVFGAGGCEPPDGEVVRRRFAGLAAELAPPGGVAPSPEAVAQGALAIAVERMAEAIRRISIQRGHDIRQAVLVCFGGAGGQHACPLADALGIRRVLLHPLAGVLSAWGIGLSRQSVLREHSPRTPLGDSALAGLEEWIERLATEASTALAAAGDLPAGLRPERQIRLELRYPGTESGLEVPWPEGPGLQPGSDGNPLEELRRRFEERHTRCFGYVVPGEPLVLERVVVEVSAPAGALTLPAIVAGSPGPGPAAADTEQVPLCLGEGGLAAAAADRCLRWRTVPLWRRERLAVGRQLLGPAVVVEATGTTVLEAGWRASVLAGGELLLERLAVGSDPTPPSAGRHGMAPEPAADPVRLELYNHRFSAIAEQMGERLRQCSQSVNIRERLDFSCALFDAAGRLVANAPHIPVHLGSMGACVASLVAAVARQARPPLGPGDAVATNDPFDGGTHLPDITVISPVFAPGPEAVGDGPLFYVACRGHHADVGGITPGSMPPFSRSIGEEGLLLRHVPLLVDGCFDARAWRRRLAAGPHPVRNPDQLLADLQAQLAANRLGVAELQRLMARQGLAEVRAYMGHVQANAAEAVRRVIERIGPGHHTVELDDGARITVAIRPDPLRRRVRIDFGGTSSQQQGNVNAPLAITRAVVLYVFRCLVGEPIPLNDGCFEPIDLLVPTGCLLNPAPPAAVVAGNVETSQAVANALFAALGVMAASQGTMNNLSFGDDRRQYYETICGGSGAGMDLEGRGFDGASAVQTHMTNSRLTDPEILEDRFPVRLESFAIRRGSGGSGRWRGGDGVVRRLRFLAPTTVAILSGNRRIAPFGLAGGGAARSGANLLLAADGRRRNLPGSAQLEVEAGDLLVIETPGGGGWGSPVGPGPGGDGRPPS